MGAITNNETTTTEGALEKKAALAKSNFTDQILAWVRYDKT